MKKRKKFIRMKDTKETERKIISNLLRFLLVAFDFFCLSLVACAIFYSCLSCTKENNGIEIKAGENQFHEKKKKKNCKDVTKLYLSAFV